ncbi:hypothetical protein RI367_005541 [Sorochytrium milnesiophthora]
MKKDGTKRPSSLRKLGALLGCFRGDDKDDKADLPPQRRAGAAEPTSLAESALGTDSIPASSYRSESVATATAAAGNGGPSPHASAFGRSVQSVTPPASPSNGQHLTVVNGDDSSNQQQPVRRRSSVALMLHTEEEVWSLYSKGYKLGTGTFADVFVVELKNSAETPAPRYALKLIHKEHIRGKESVIRREIDVLRKTANHPHLVGLIPGPNSFFETEDYFYLITELCEGGELFDSIVNRGFYSEHDAAEVVAQILDALVYCHDLGIVHRDLKPENLLLKDTSPHARVMVSDFGLSRLTESEGQLFKTMCGTPGYVAPEVILNTGHGKPCDMWSLGCITYVLLCGYIPFWGEEQRSLFDEIVNVRYAYDEEYWSEVSDMAKDFIDRLLLADPSARMTAQQAMAHPWIGQVRNDPSLNLMCMPSLERKNLLGSMQRGKQKHPSKNRAVNAVNAVIAANRLMNGGQSGSSNNNTLERAAEEQQQPLSPQIEVIESDDILLPSAAAAEADQRPAGHHMADDTTASQGSGVRSIQDVDALLQKYSNIVSSREQLLVRSSTHRLYAAADITTTAELPATDKTARLTPLDVGPPVATPPPAAEPTPATKTTATTSTRRTPPSIVQTSRQVFLGLSQTGRALTVQPTSPERNATARQGTVSLRRNTTSEQSPRHYTTASAGLGDGSMFRDRGKVGVSKFIQQRTATAAAAVDQQTEPNVVITSFGGAALPGAGVRGLTRRSPDKEHRAETTQQPQRPSVTAKAIDAAIDASGLASPPALTPAHPHRPSHISELYRADPDLLHTKAAAAAAVTANATSGQKDAVDTHPVLEFVHAKMPNAHIHQHRHAHQELAAHLSSSKSPDERAASPTDDEQPFGDVGWHPPLRFTDDFARLRLKGTSLPVMASIMPQPPQWHFAPVKLMWELTQRSVMWQPSLNAPPPSVAASIEFLDQATQDPATLIDPPDMLKLPDEQDLERPEWFKHKLPTAQDLNIRASRAKTELPKIRSPNAMKKPKTARRWDNLLQTDSDTEKVTEATPKETAATEATESGGDMAADATEAEDTAFGLGPLSASKSRAATATVRQAAVDGNKGELASSPGTRNTSSTFGGEDAQQALTRPPSSFLLKQELQTLGLEHKPLAASAGRRMSVAPNSQHEISQQTSNAAAPESSTQPPRAKSGFFHTDSVTNTHESNASLHSSATTVNRGKVTSAVPHMVNITSANSHEDLSFSSHKQEQVCDGTPASVWQYLSDWEGWYDIRTEEQLTLDFSYDEVGNISYNVNVAPISWVMLNDRRLPDAEVGADLLHETQCQYEVNKMANQGTASAEMQYALAFWHARCGLYELALEETRATYPTSSTSGKLFSQGGGLSWLAVTDFGDVDAIDSARKFLRAQLYIIIGQNDAAFRELDAIAAKDKACLEMWTMKGRLFQCLGPSRNALNGYSHAVKAMPLFWRAHFERGLIYEDLQDAFYAFEEFRHVRRIKPDYVRAIWKHTFYYMDKQLWDDVLVNVNQVVQLEPSDPEAYFIRARAYAHVHQFENSLKDFYMAITLAPHTAKYYLHRGCLLREKNTKWALQDLSTSLLLDDSINNSDAWLFRVLEIDPMNPYLNLNLGILCMQFLEDYVQSLQYLDRVMDQDPLLLRAYYCRAELFQLLHQESSLVSSTIARKLKRGSINFLQRAIREYSRAIRLYPRNYALYLYRGRLLLKQNKTDLAMHDFHTAFEINSGIAQTFLQRALILSFQGRYNQVIEEYEKMRSEGIVFDSGTLVLIAKAKMKCQDAKGALEVLSDSSLKNEKEPQLYLNRGLCLQALKEFNKACVEFSKCITLSPKFSKAWYCRGMCKLQFGDMTGVQDIDQAIRYDPKYLEAYLSRASHYDKTGEYAQGIEDCNTAIRLEPTSIRAFLTRGSLKCKLHQFGLAISDFTAAAELDKDCMLAYLYRAMAYEQLREFDDALRDYSIVLLIKENPMVYRHRAILYYQMELFDNALRDLLAAKEGLQGDMNLYGIIGLCYLKVEDIPKSIETYTEIIRMHPVANEGYLGRANAYATKGDMKAATNDYLRVLHISPKCVEAYVCMGNLMHRASKLKQAWEFFSAALAIDPRNTAALQGRAIIHVLTKNYFAAMLDMNTAVSYRPNSAELLVNRGVVFQSIGDASSAMRDYKAAAQLEPPYYLAFFNAANLYFHQQSWEHALDYYTQAQRLAPNNPVVRMNKALTRYELRDIDGALEDFQHALMHCTSLNERAQVLFNRSKVLQDLGRHEEAERGYSQVVELLPANLEAWKKRGENRSHLSMTRQALEDYAHAIVLELDGQQEPQQR